VAWVYELLFELRFNFLVCSDRVMYDVNIVEYCSCLTV
jgi:hypothetical protein